MKNYIVFALLVAAAAYFFGQQQQNSSSVDIASRPDYELTMYSLTTCGFCKQKVKELGRHRIEFTEHFIDTDKAVMREVTAKLERAGFAPQRYGTPIFEANGVMLPNNPKMSVIKSRLGFDE